MTKYLLLMRHGKHEADLSSPLSPPAARKLSADGLKETKDVVEKLGEVLKELSGDDELAINLRNVWVASSDEVIETIEVVRNVLNEPALNYQIVEHLNPAVFKAYRNIEKHKEVTQQVKEALLPGDAHEAVMLIGHQPFLSWVACEVRGEPIPLKHSEIACIAFDKLSRHKKARGYLRWVISPSTRSSSVEMAELKAKIKSKMAIAKTLGATITVVLAFQLGYLVDNEKLKPLETDRVALWALWLSTGAFFIALALFLATIYAYDRLLMPTRFWGEAPLPRNPKKRPKWLVWRPPSSAVWVLYQNMMRVWTYFFNGATGAVILGFVLLAYAVFHPGRPVLFFVSAAAGLGLFLLGYIKFGPHLGSED